MTPPPPATLLHPGARWITVPAAGWQLVPPRRRDANQPYACRINVGADERTRCGQPAIAVDCSGRGAKPGFGGCYPVCAGHLGDFRWIENGVVMQWRADPPFTAYRRRKP